jgi:uncharacterized protein YbjT (DUF2867 family)
MNAKILVLGATGNVGSALISQLVAAGEKVKAASRKAVPVTGAEAVRFDYGDASTYAAAFDGVDRAYVLVPAGRVDILELLTPVLKVAVARKVKVVFQSAIGVDADDSIPYRQAELFLERSGVPYVILRPNWFADNFHTYWHAGVQSGTIAVPAGDGKTSFIDTRDIAAAALRSSKFDNQAFNLTGPEALSYTDAASILSKVVGRTIRYTPVDDATFIAAMTSAGVSKDYASLLAALFYPVREGWTARVTSDVQTLTGRLPRSVAEYATDHAALLKS